MLGFGSVVIYHGINKNVSEPIEKATDTDAYVSNEGDGNTYHRATKTLFL